MDEQAMEGATSVKDKAHARRLLADLEADLRRQHPLWSSRRIRRTLQRRGCDHTDDRTYDGKWCGFCDPSLGGQGAPLAEDYDHA